jgi:hypothetical protein
MQSVKHIKSFTSDRVNGFGHAANCQNIMPLLFQGVFYPGPLPQLIVHDKYTGFLHNVSVTS